MNFDRVARFYAVLENLAFFGALNRARKSLLPVLSDALGSSPRIGVPGSGDGRLLEALLKAFPEAYLVATEPSKAMRAMASQRLGELSSDRLSYRESLQSERLDALVACFYYDNFEESQALEHLRRDLNDLASREAYLLLVDFRPNVRPVCFFGSLEFLMLWFFRHSCGVQARRILDLGEFCETQGWEKCCVRRHFGGFVECGLWKKLKSSA